VRKQATRRSRPAGDAASGRLAQHKRAAVKKPYSGVVGRIYVVPYCLPGMAETQPPKCGTQQQRQKV